MEALVSENLDEKLDFSTLRSAIASVQAASAQLDIEKEAAVEDFEKLLKHLPPYPSSLLVELRRPRRSCWNPRIWNSMPSLTTRAKDWVKGIFGVPPTLVTAASWDIVKTFGEDSWGSVLSYAYAAPGKAEAVLPPWLPHPVRRFIEAARRLGRSNKKLIAFERGFISEGGIKDREWYKHLGVAPGKWLGKLLWTCHHIQSANEV